MEKHQRCRFDNKYADISFQTITSMYEMIYRNIVTFLGILPWQVEQRHDRFITDEAGSQQERKAEI